MKEVKIKITETGWELNANVNGEFFTERGEMTIFGASHSGDELDDVEWMSDDLYDALGSFFCYDVAKALGGE